MARALRKLSPDSALFCRRAREESLRDLAPDYGVVHTSLSRYFATGEGARRLLQAKQELAAERMRPEAGPPSPAGPPSRALAEPPAPRAERRRPGGGRILGASADRRVRLVTESGETVGRTRQSNLERMTAALEPRYGPLTVVPA
jgi:hypothetical protein